MLRSKIKFFSFPFPTFFPYIFLHWSSSCAHSSCWLVFVQPLPLSMLS